MKIHSKRPTSRAPKKKRLLNYQGTITIRDMIFPKTVQYSKSFPRNYPVLEINNTSCYAKIALHGAHLMDWTPRQEKPVLYTSPGAIFKEGKAIRGGIPVCWPWFNAHPTDSTLPSHGIGRNRFWGLESVVGTEEKTIITLVLKNSLETEAVWNHHFHTTMKISLGKEANIELKTKNMGDVPYEIGGALHTYLAVSDVSTIKVSGLSGHSYIDTVGTETVRTQSEELTVNEEVDQIYLNTEDDIILSDPNWNRKITVSRSGSKSAVVWNPWKEKAQSLTDLPDESYKDFLCIEAANAREDVYLLKPGEEHCLQTSLKTSSM